MENLKKYLISLFLLIGIGCGIVFQYLSSLNFVDVTQKRTFKEVGLIDENCITKNDPLYWGPYSPGNYFVIKNISPTPILFGILWFRPNEMHPSIRFTCRPEDNLNGYNWLDNNPFSHGVEQIIDRDIAINISYVKTQSSKGYQWSARVSLSALNELPKEISIVPFIYSPNQINAFDTSKEEKIIGHNEELGKFVLSYSDIHESTHVSQMTSGVIRDDAILNSLLGGLQRDFNGARVTLNAEPFKQALERDMADMKKNIIFNEFSYQLDGNLTRTLPWHSFVKGPLKASAQLDVLEIHFEYENSDKPALKLDEFSSTFNSLSNSFHETFRDKFAQSANFKQYLDLGRIAMSNLFGGIGYFYGSSVVKSNDEMEGTFEYGPKGLLTATPSRHQFPRGFMWDEGFHLLVTAKWSVDLALKILSHWFDLMNNEGWIAREQILGYEARSRVPAEFLVQSDKIANPPALILAVDDLLDRYSNMDSVDQSLLSTWCDKALPRLHKWYQWFNKTQSGEVYSSYRWRGRKDSHGVLIPLTLSSGLDDFPRSSHPSSDERHLDLRCWMAHFSKVVLRVVEFVRAEKGAANNQLAAQLQPLYKEWTDVLHDEKLLNDLHWSDSVNRYADYGFHTDAISLIQVRDQNQEHWVRKVSERPRTQLILNGHGYLSLFPLALKVLPPKSEQLSILLRDLDRKEHLWTPYGLRSLSKASKFYDQPNSEHDQPYWRGAIWINMNYLVMKSLRYYANHNETPKAVVQMANRLFEELRENVLVNVMRQFNETGFLWEQYNDATGKGQRAHPFSGWTSLVSLMFSL